MFEPNHIKKILEVISKRYAANLLMISIIISVMEFLSIFTIYPVFYYLENKILIGTDLYQSVVFFIMNHVPFTIFQVVILLSSIVIVLTHLMIFFRNQITNNKIERRIFLIFSILSIVSLFLIQYYSVPIDRIILYVSILQVFVLSRLSYIFKNDYTVKVVNTFILIFYSFILFVWLNYAIHSHAWMPYMNLFFHN